MIYSKHQINAVIYREGIELMKQNIHIQTADPAGNITVFVLDRFERNQYQHIASQLLSMKELKAEQVAFVTGEDSMEMCGLEFCGNASRAFALLLAKKRNVRGDAFIDISVSGIRERLTVAVNPEKNYTKIRMPLPLSVENWENTGTPLPARCQAVDFGGILHIVLRDEIPSKERFDQIKEYIYSLADPPALGVMFYDSKKNLMTPVVYVKDVNTTYFEGSCGSGSTAAAAAFSADEGDGTFQFTLSQPAGVITASVEKRNGVINAVYIEGPVSFGSVMEVAVETD